MFSPQFRLALRCASTRALVVFLALCAANSLIALCFEWSLTAPFHSFGHALLLTAGVDHSVGTSYVVLALAVVLPQLAVAAAVGVVSLALEAWRLRRKRLV